MSLRYKGGVISATPPTVSTTSAPGVWTLPQQFQYQGAGTWPLPVVPDPYFENVIGLFHFDGTNGAQNNTFLDSSTNAFTITRNGNPTQGSLTPFSRSNGYWSNYFNNSGYLNLGSNTALLPGSGNFTIEAWFNASAFNLGGGTGYQAIFSYGGGNGNIRVFLNGTTPNLQFWNGSSNAINASTSIKMGEWHHVALVRSGSNITLYLDGTSVGTVASSDNYTGTLYVGAEANGYYWSGYISNFRMVKGTALYTSSFTPPTAPLTAVANTGALTCQSNRFIDNSANNFAVTVVSNPSIEAFGPFNPTTAYSTTTNGGSGYFDGTGDYLTYSTPAASVREWWTGDYTCEAWIYPTTLANWSNNGSGIRPGLIGNMTPNDDTTYWAFGINGADGEVRLYYFNGSAVSVGSSLYVKANQWNHIAFTKTSSGITFFCNGVGSSITAVSGTPQSASGTPITIGSARNTSIAGYIGGLRVIYGTAQYSGATYTVPTAPPTAITNTSLLLNFTNAGAFDNAAIEDYETVGTSQLSTTQFKFGTSSLALNGTTSTNQNTLRGALFSPNFQLGSGTFTIEGFLRLNSSSISYPYIWTLVRSDGVNALTMFFGDAGYSYNLLIYYNNNLINVNNAASRQSAFLNTWKHFAFVRDSASTFTVYVDGVSVYSSAAFTTDFNAACKLHFGSYGDGSTYGYLDEFRITKGVARYTANFTPPIAAFPNL